MKRSLSIFAGLALLASPAWAANDGPQSVVGTYAGTFLCSLGEMGMTLSLSDMSQIELESRTPCKTGSGQCNDARASRMISGTLNFFPTVGNPNSPAGAFKVSGTVRKATRKIARIELEPGDWIDQPEGFGSSGLTATIYDGNINGKPTAAGCLDLKMRKLKP